MAPTTNNRSVSEVGHARNVANFYALISYVTSYGPVYNPTKNSLQLPQLSALYTMAQSDLADVAAKNTHFNKKINERFVDFSNLEPLATRIVNALDATDATPQIMADAKSFIRKLRGKRARTTVDPNTPAPASISTSQQSYDQLIEHFGGLLLVAGSESSYEPNESELRIPILNARKLSLTAKNNEVADAHTAVSSSRIARNKTIYGEDTGIVAIASEVKKYVKSLFGASSPEYAQIKGLQFKTIPN